MTANPREVDEQDRESRAACRARSSSLTSGLRISAIVLAAIRISRTVPAARASAHRPSTASGSTTSWTHRGTTTGGGGNGRLLDRADRSGSGRDAILDVRARPRRSARRPRRRWAVRRPVAWGTSNACSWKYEHRQDVSETVSILFVGDVVGGIGKRTLLALLPSLRDRYAPDFVVVNGENAAGGVGITPKIAGELFAAGVDVITLGNHTYRHREIYAYLDEEERILRPANFLRQPARPRVVRGRGASGVRLGVVSLSGNLFMNAGRPAFAEADAALHALDGQGRPRARRHARRGDEREGGDGLAPRRPRDRRRRHPHARPDRRRPDPARRHRLHHRRRHDRAARRRDRRQARAGARRRWSRRCRSGSRPRPRIRG